MSDMSDFPVEWLKAEVAKLRLEPGDIVVYTHPSWLTREQRLSIAKTWRECILPAIGFECRIIVLEPGMTLTKLTREQLATLLDTEPANEGRS